MGASAAAAGGGDGGECQQQGVGGRDEHRATEAEPHVTKEIGTVGPNVEPVGLGTMAEGSPIVGGSSTSVGGSGAGGGDVEPIGSLRGIRQEAKGL
ncbi:hypothetical protein RHMOL_Rhmol06G0120400 [Rhododendron molle]|uniref:Uncharacterized protein n=1 Tax=Rhododendron molle TaxID=49168 RepID=A0ACC0NBL1_RHOML|nr:hypothetical protein RHMOL_Rhmol06G0120400 [Rhododendron molle]